MALRSFRLPSTAEGAILLVPFLFFAAHNLVYLSFYGRPPHYDQAYQVTLSLDMADALSERPLPGLDRILDVSGFYPPLLYLYTAPWYGLVGRSLYVARASQLGFLLILLFSVYGLGRRLGGPRVGLLAAALVGLYPIVFGTSRYYTNDFPLTAMTALALERLLACDGFRRLGPSLHFGLACAAGMLVKWTFVCFLAPAVVYALLWRSFDLAPERGLGLVVRDLTRRGWLYAAFGLAWAGLLFGVSRVFLEGGATRAVWFATTALLVLLVGALSRRLRAAFPSAPPRARRCPDGVAIGVTGAFLAALLPAWPWYFRHSDYVLSKAATVVDDLSALRGMPEITRPEAWSYYASTLLTHQLHLFFFALAFLACVWAVWKGGLPRALALLFFAQYLVVSAIRHKDPRYFMPALPILAALSAWWVLSAIPARWNRWVVALALVVGVVQMEAISWGSPLPREVRWEGVQLWKQHGYGSQEGLGEGWPLEAMLRAARARLPSAGPDRPATLALFANHDALHFEAFNVYAKLARLPVRTRFAGDLHPRADQATWMALAHDFLILKSGELGPRFSLGVLDEMRQRLSADAHPRLPMHDLVERWSLPDGSSAALYQRRPSDGLPVRFGDLAVLEQARLEWEHPDDPHARRLEVQWRQMDESQRAGVLVFIHLLSGDGAHLAAYSDPLLPQGRTSVREGGLAARYLIPLPADLAPGTYRLRFGLHRPELDGELRIPASNGDDAVEVVPPFSFP